VGRYPVGIVHFEPPFYPKVRFKNVVKRIGYTIFETDRIPDEWVTLCEHMDEVWLPSRFNYETFVASGVEPAVLRIFPYGVDTEFFRPLSERLAIEGQRGFCFLYVFPFDWRKGFDLLLEAYRSEFRAEDDVTLVLKTQSDRYPPRELERRILGCVTDAGAGRKDLPRVIILTKPVDLVQLRQLYNTCDLYISTERANGWGMPCMEAMAMGKPAATIDWSGSTEFMNEQNSLLIKPTGRLVPVDERLAEARPLYRGHRWAEVTVDEVRRVLRLAYEHRDVLARVARQGIQDVREHYSHVRAAERMRDYLLSMPVTAWRIGRPDMSLRRPPLWSRAVGKVVTILKTYGMGRLGHKAGTDAVQRS
jgi:glycosyltransferase involved in cell wall biosynthesis